MNSGQQNISFEERLDFLGGLDIFQDLSVNILEQIGMGMIEKKYVRQESIVKKGDVGDTMYIIIKGEVRVHDKGHVHTRMSAGDVFGEYSLFDDEVRSASVTAEKVTHVLELNRHNFNSICDQYPEMYKGFISQFVKRMRERNVLEEKLSKSYIRIQKQSEEIKRGHEFINQQKELLEQQNYDLLSLNEEKNKLIKLVVHGLKNPLTSSLCITDVLLDSNKLEEEQEENLTIIKNSLGRINRMINQTLDVNSIESKVFVLRKEKIFLKQIVENISNSFLYSIQEKEIELEREIESVSACLNRVYFAQITDNLISRTIKETQEGGKIKITLSKESKLVKLHIWSNSKSLESHNPETIFDQYKRQEDNFNSMQNTEGLGLAIVKKYAEEMEGKVSFKNKKGEGAEFTVTFSCDC